MLGHKITIISLLIFQWFFSPAQSWQWSRSISGNSSDYPFDISVDSRGNCYSLSSFADTAIIDSIMYISSSTWEMILIKWDSVGQIQWSKQLDCANNGGYIIKMVPSITTDRCGNIYLMAEFFKSLQIDNENLVSYHDTCTVYSCPDSCWFLNDCNCPLISYLDTCYVKDLYIGKFSPQGNLLWLKQITSPYSKIGLSIAVDSMYNLYITGSFYEKIFLDSITLTSNGSYTGMDIFIAKFDSSGDILWASGAGSNKSNSDLAFSIAIDDSGNVFITGVCQDSAYFNGNLVVERGSFAAKYDNNGVCLWAKSLGQYGTGYGIAVDNSGNCYVGGENYLNNIFIAKLDVSGNILWKKIIDGSLYVTLMDIKTDDYGNCYAVGSFSGTTTFDAVTLIPADWDIYIASYDTYGNLIWIKQAGGMNTDAGQSITIGSNNDIFITGFFQDTVFFDNHQLNAWGWSEVFITKISAAVYLSPDTCFSPILGVNKIHPNSDEVMLTVYPNPVTNSMEVFLPENFSAVQCHINDITGKTVYLAQGKNLSGSKKSISLQTASLTAGVYYISITDAGGARVGAVFVKE